MKNLNFFDILSPMTNTDIEFSLPLEIAKVKAPPIKCQGIKTKLVKFIANSSKWDGNGRWIEPFLGSGAVLFNINPDKALVSDTNIHIINVYNDLKKNIISSKDVLMYLQEQGNMLSSKGEEHFYDIREKFNKNPNSLDFIFLSRSCFNGVMRFNKKGYFNVPFCKKIERFRQAYVTKIVNQIKWIESIIKDKDWEFISQDWKITIENCNHNDFIYADPPYLGRHTDYYNQWSDEENEKLVYSLINSNSGFALSTWFENKYRKNILFDFLDMNKVVIKKFSHFYHVGSSEDLRNEMIEALVIDREHSN